MNKEKGKYNVEIRELQCRKYLHVKKSNVGITCMLKKRMLKVTLQKNTYFYKLS